MAPAIPQQFPDPAVYRAQLIGEGAVFPLPRVPWSPEGLLDVLPPPPPGKTGWPWTVQTPPWSSPGPATVPMSIVIPSYEQGDYIEEALRSVLLQNHPALEFIIMDSGSGKAVHRVLERYRPWISHLRCAHDRGQAHAINLGFSLACDHGLRAWLNSDDFYLPGAFRSVNQAHQDNHATFIYGDQLILEQEKARLRIEALPPALDRYVKFNGLVASHSAFWHASRHQPVWEEHHCAIDYELWIRLLPGTRKTYLPRPLGLVRHHAGAKTFSPALESKWQEDADRNGRAHPHLYLPRPWLDWEFRLLTRFLRGWRKPRLKSELADICRECGWPVPKYP